MNPLLRPGYHDLVPSLGSPLWRLLNYGPLAVTRYFFYDICKFKSIKTSLDYQLAGAEGVISIFGLRKDECDAMRDLATEFLVTAALELKRSGLDFKESTIDQGKSINRLFVIGAMLVTKKPDLFVETGTQHGLSASFACLVIEKFGLKTQVVSFDVKNTNCARLESCAKFEDLGFPLRKSLKKKFSQLRLREYGKTIFFHDSDHSYENMNWELKAAKEILGAQFFIIDDAESSLAIFDFEKRIERLPILVKIDDGPSVGVFTQKDCDPDGT